MKEKDRPCNMALCGARIYRPGEQKSDEKGTFRGWGAKFDEWVPIFSTRILPFCCGYTKPIAHIDVPQSELILMADRERDSWFNRECKEYDTKKIDPYTLFAWFPKLMDQAGFTHWDNLGVGTENKGNEFCTYFRVWQKNHKKWRVQKNEPKRE